MRENRIHTGNSLKLILPSLSWGSLHLPVLLHLHHFLFFKKIILFHLFIFIYLVLFCLPWVFIAPCGLSLVAASGGYSSLWCAGFSLSWLLLLRSMGSRHVGFSSCSTRAQQLWLTGLVAPRHVGASRTRDRTHVPCIDSWIFNHCVTRKVLHHFLKL